MAHRAFLGVNKILPKKVESKQFKNLLILDFEATCDSDKILKPQEIIEFPCLAVSTEDWEVKDIFHKYIKPRVNPQLTTFCIDFTGIMQETVEDEKYFPEVFSQFCQWLKEGNYFNEEGQSAFVTCGDWDLKVMLPEQCKLDNVEMPSIFKEWINLKTTFGLATDHYPRSLKNMLQHFKMGFEGKNHCGIDDVHNIARVIKTLALKHKPQFVITSNFDPKKIAANF